MAHQLNDLAVKSRPAIKRATLLPLIGITYCMVAGGPFGLEDLVRLSGYRGAIILLLVTPLIWSFPVTLMVSELSGALPEEGGYYVWVRRGLGPFWGFQEAWLSFADSIFDMAIYPTLFVGYLAQLWPGAQEGNWGTLIGISVITLCVGLNLAGIRPVGAGSLAMTVALLLPFVAIIALAPASHVRAAAPQPAPAGAGFFGGILLAMWNYAGWDNLSTFAGEVERPQRTYPLAMLIALALAAATYILPIAAMSKSGIPAASWETNSWVEIGRTIGSAIGPGIGQELAVALTAAGMISAFAIFNALILSYSRVPLAMAEDGFLPRVMALRTRAGVPWVSLLVCAIGWGLCMKLGFLKLVILDTVVYALGLILEFAALVALRLREPNLPRGYKVPGGVIGCVLISIAPIVLIGIALVAAMRDESARPGLFTSGVVLVAGIVIYFIVAAVSPRLRRQREEDRRGFPVPLREPQQSAPNGASGES